MVDSRETSARLEETIRIARLAGEVALRHFHNLRDLEVEKKGRQDYVSAADREVEDRIRMELAKTFPGEQFLGEESGGQPGEAIWVVDPIDGTTNFLRGIPSFAISIAFVHRGRIEVGVIHQPTEGAIYAATSDGPATLNDLPLSVRPSTRLDEALLGVGSGPTQDHHRFVILLERALSSGAEFRRFGSAALGLAQVASGQLDAFWQEHLSSWDVLAGLLIIERAGGVVCDFLAGDGLLRGNPVLASTPGLAAALSAILEVPLKGEA